MKRFLCGFLCLCFLWTGISLAFAEDDEEDPGLIDELIDENSQKYGEVIETAPGRWALVKEGVVNTDFTGVAENANGIWYLENGYVNFNFSGTLTDGKGTAYTVEKGQVVSQKAAE